MPMPMPPPWTPSSADHPRVPPLTAGARFNLAPIGSANALSPVDRCYCSDMIRSNSTKGLTGTSSLRVTVAAWMMAVQGNGAS
jgi:hypothetical protein